jgi:hypothetical protein
VEHRNNGTAEQWNSGTAEQQNSRTHPSYLFDFQSIAEITKVFVKLYLVFETL